MAFAVVLDFGAVGGGARECAPCESGARLHRVDGFVLCGVKVLCCALIYDARWMPPKLCSFRLRRALTTVCLVRSDIAGMGGLGEFWGPWRALARFCWIWRLTSVGDGRFGYIAVALGIELLFSVCG